MPTELFLGAADPDLGGSPLQPVVVSTPMSSVDTPGGSGHAAEIQTAPFICLDESTRKMTAGKGRAEVWGPFLQAAEREEQTMGSPEAVTGAWRELLELGAGWESQCWAVVFILELLESIPRKKRLRGLSWVSPAGGLRAQLRGCARTFLHCWLHFLSGFLLLRRKLNLSPCWEVKKSQFPSAWSFKQPGMGLRKAGCRTKSLFMIVETAFLEKPCSFHGGASYR